MSLMRKLKDQHKRSVAQMKEHKEDLKKAKEGLKESFKDIRKSTQEAKQEFEQIKQDFKKDMAEIEKNYQREMEKYRVKCPQCGSMGVKNHKQHSTGLIILSILTMIFGTLFLGIFGFMIGSILMIIPGVQMIKGVFSPKKECKSCKYIWGKTS